MMASKVPEKEKICKCGRILVEGGPFKRCPRCIKSGLSKAAYIGPLCVAVVKIVGDKTHSYSDIVQTLRKNK